LHWVLFYDCNQAKTEHRKTSLLFKTTPETAFCREIYVADIYTIKNQNYLTCIDLYSKYGTAIELNAKDWMEVKRGLFRIFNSMGKPRTLKTDRDSAFMSIALKNWLDTEDVNIQITTSKNGVSDVERLHKTINEEIRETENSDNTENKLMKIEVNICRRAQINHQRFDFHLSDINVNNNDANG